MILFSDIRQRIQSCQTEIIPVKGKRQASVALILCDLISDPKIFFIERAKNQNDPWSGQIAFPGGNRESGDNSLFFTACRETEEEVGLRLLPQDLLGRLDDQQGRNSYQRLPLVISCFVFDMEDDQQTVNNSEVEDSFWVSVSYLLDVDNKINYQTEHADNPYPGICLGGHRVLWGLTYQFVQMFLKVIA